MYPIPVLLGRRWIYHVLKELLTLTAWWKRGRILAAFVLWDGCTSVYGVVEKSFMKLIQYRSPFESN
jgi:hypothetical protein